MGRRLGSAIVVVLGGLVACAPARPTQRPAAARGPVEAVRPRGAARRAPVIPAPRRPVTRTYFGATVVDEYEWLEDGGSAEVQSFVEQQNRLSRQTLDGLPERAEVRERIAALLSATSPDWPVLRFEGGRLFALKDAPPNPQRVLVVFGSKEADLASERVLVDPSKIDPSGKTTIDFFTPSPDGKLVAVSLSKGGSESGDLHLVDVATGKDRDETVTRVNGGTAGGSVAWNVDGSGFYYTRYPRPGERPAADLDFYQQVWFHKLGTPESADVYAIGRDFPRIAEVTLVRSDDGKRIVAHVANGDGGDVEHHVAEGSPPGKWARLTRFEDEVSAVAFGPDGRIYAVSRKKAPRGKVIVFGPALDRAPEDVLPEGDAVIDDLVVTKSAVLTRETADGPSRIRRFPLGGKPEPLAREPSVGGKKTAAKPAPPVTIAPGARGVAAAVLPIPPVSNVSGAVRVGDDVLFRIESFVDPPRWVLYRTSDHRFAPTPLVKKAAFAMDDVEVVRETCLSKDGTRVPMSVLAKRGSKRDGSMPGYLTGYGGFAISLRPRQRPAYRVWLDHGGVVAEANLRGGGERGEAWHKAGSLTKKQNVFDDFVACARTLVERGYTKPERLGIVGGSNGGLLMGAVTVQSPSSFRAVVSAVGLYDMLRSELSPNGAFNVTELGSVKDEAQFRALHAYSPLHQVKDDVAYPSMLFLTGANDPRVDPYHSRKMVARLQAATSASPSDRPILLRASGDTGHGAGTPLAAEIEELTDKLAFLLHETRRP